MSWELLLQYVITGLSNGLIIALIALGYSMVYGIVELINFAHGDLFMLGAFLALTLVGSAGLEALAGIEPGSAVAWGLISALIPASALFCAGLNWGVDRIAYRPLRGAPKLTSLVSAIGMSFILINVGLFWGAMPMEVFGDGRAAANPKDVPDLIGYHNLLGDDSLLQFTTRDLLVWLVTVPLMIALTVFVTRTRLGTAMRACAQNPTAARLMGIDVDKVVGAAFLIGGALAGAASVVYAFTNNSVVFTMGFRNGMDAFTAAVLGGIGNLPGAVLGGLLIGLARALTESLPGGNQWANTTVFVVLVLVLVFRPNGLLGAHVREKV